MSPGGAGLSALSLEPGLGGGEVTSPRGSVCLAMAWGTPAEPPSRWANQRSRENHWFSWRARPSGGCTVRCTAVVPTVGIDVRGAAPLLLPVGIFTNPPASESQKKTQSVETINKLQHIRHCHPTPGLLNFVLIRVSLFLSQHFFPTAGYRSFLCGDLTNC